MNEKLIHCTWLMVINNQTVDQQQYIDISMARLEDLVFLVAPWFVNALGVQLVSTPRPVFAAPGVLRRYHVFLLALRGP